MLQALLSGLLRYCVPFLKILENLKLKVVLLPNVIRLADYGVQE